MSAPIFDKRKQLVISERTIRCRRTGTRITNRVEFNEDAVPQLVEHITLESSESYQRAIAKVLTS